MRISTYNAENLFLRASVLRRDSWDEGRPLLEDIGTLNSLIAKDTYSDSVKSKIVALLEKYGFGKGNTARKPFDITEVRDRLYTSGKGGLKIVADGRESWVGWIKFDREGLDGAEVHNTGRVVAEVKADVQCMVEIENRVALKLFNNQALKEFPGVSFEHNMSIVGNDRRGIDIGLLSRYPIVSIHSHIDDGGAKPIFSRDCPEYEIALPDGKSLWFLGNHLKSQGYGSQADNDAKRKNQAQRVAEIYAEVRKRSDLVVVAGDMNDSPDSDCMKPLIADTDLKDVTTHEAYAGPPGTWTTCSTAKYKFDYILLSPTLWRQVKSVGLERRGIFSKKPGESFDSVTSTVNQASDHAALWAELDL